MHAPRNPTHAYQSAEQVAFVRALGARETDAHVRNPDQLARHFVHAGLRALLRIPPFARWLLEHRAPGVYPYHIARTKHFDATLHEAMQCGIAQIVILGAGYDTRAYRLAIPAHVKFFEVDFPGTQARKRERLGKIFPTAPAHVTYAAIDFTRESLHVVLQQSGYQPSARTLFLWEGVSYYLPQAAVAVVLAFVAENAAPGSAILFDYSRRTFVDGDHSTFGAPAFARWLQQVGEPFLFGLEPAEMAGFLRACGLTTLTDYSSAELNRRYVARADGHTPWRIVDHLRIVHAGTAG